MVFVVRMESLCETKVRKFILSLLLLRTACTEALDWMWQGASYCRLGFELRKTLPRGKLGLSELLKLHRITSILPHIIELLYVKLVGNCLAW